MSQTYKIDRGQMLTDKNGKMTFYGEGFHVIDAPTAKAIEESGAKVTKEEAPKQG